MKSFKRIIMALHGENKEKAGRLYQDRQVHISSLSSSEQPIEEERVFYYRGLSFQFAGTGIYRKERMNLFIRIPLEYIFREAAETEGICPMLPYEDFLLRTLSPVVADFSSQLENDKKDSREKAAFAAQKVNECIVRRSGLVYYPEENAFVFRLLFKLPLINGIRINAKSGYRAVRNLLEKIKEALDGLDLENLSYHVLTYCHQKEIQRWLLENDMVAFVGDGSILPRQGGSRFPLAEAVPFSSPENLRRTISFDDGSEVTGMAIPKGVTVVTGGGYSGKSTLLDALETGIYCHIPGDGREYVISIPSCEKIYAEDGRPIQDVDLSPFFRDTPSGMSFQHFSTNHASGSVSQAANIIEALYAGCQLLLIDEDTSATNFMIRDDLMRQLIEREPIIPFTDRVRALFEQEGVSTILVIGGSGEYLCRADLILMMEGYQAYDVTERARTIAAGGTAHRNVVSSFGGMKCRYLKKSERQDSFYVSRFLHVERTSLIQIHDDTADVTRLTALCSEDQLKTLVYLLERMLSVQDCSFVECNDRATELVSLIYEPGIVYQIQGGACQFDFFMEAIRPMELLGALFRLRGSEIKGRIACPKKL